MDGLVTWMLKIRQMPSAKRIARSIMMRLLAVTAVIVTFVGCNQIVTAAHSATGSGSPGDPNIKYIGRWEISSPTVRISHWPGAYFKTNFTGRTVKIKLAGSANIYASIDHGPYISYNGATGTVDLTPKSLAAKTHSLIVATATEYDLLQFEGLVLDPGAKTVAPTVSSKLIEFVGDSITAGGRSSQWAVSGYAWVIGQRLSVEHTQIAQGGIPLVGGSNGAGMSTQYFKMATTYSPNSPNWNFSRYQANAVVINLGTCDGGSVSDATFQSTYITFLRNIRKRFPHAHIFVLEIFLGAKVAPTTAAVQAVRAAGDHNVRYVDTTGWISSSDTVDGIHPSAAAHIKIANHLGPIIASAIGLGKSRQVL